MLRTVSELPPDRASDEAAALLAKLDHPRRAEIEVLRRIILAVDARVREGVKWNAPSYHIGTHFATFKLRPRDAVQVVLHTDAKKRSLPRPLTVDDPGGMLKWAAEDRCVATFVDADDVDAKGAAFASIVEQWIAQTCG